MTSTSATTNLYIFNGGVGNQSFQFIIIANSESQARLKLLASSILGNYHECQGNYACDANGVFHSDEISYPNGPLNGDSVKWLKINNFTQYVIQTYVEEKKMTDVLFSSAILGYSTST